MLTCRFCPEEGQQFARIAFIVCSQMMMVILVYYWLPCWLPENTFTIKGKDDFFQISLISQVTDQVMYIFSLCIHYIHSKPLVIWVVLKGISGCCPPPPGTMWHHYLRICFAKFNFILFSLQSSFLHYAQHLHLNPSDPSRERSEFIYRRRTSKDFLLFLPSFMPSSSVILPALIVHGRQYVHQQYEEAS